MPRRKRTQTYEECSPEIQERIIKATVCHNLVRVGPCDKEEVTKTFFEDPRLFKREEKNQSKKHFEVPTAGGFENIFKLVPTAGGFEHMLKPVPTAGGFENILKLVPTAGGFENILKSRLREALSTC